jgi:hypothetical protein
MSFWQSFLFILASPHHRLPSSLTLLRLCSSPQNIVKTSRFRSNHSSNQHPSHCSIFFISFYLFPSNSSSAVFWSSDHLIFTSNNQILTIMETVDPKDIIIHPFQVAGHGTLLTFKGPDGSHRVLKPWMKIEAEFYEYVSTVSSLYLHLRFLFLTPSTCYFPPVEPRRCFHSRVGT